MRDSLPEWMSGLLVRSAGATLVFGLALFCGRFVEEAAQSRHMAQMAAMTPRQVTPLSASLTVDRAEALPPLQAPPQMACTPALSLDSKPGALLVVTLTADCAADTRVEIAHGGMRFSARMPIGRPLHLTLPALDAGGHVVVTMSDGTLVQTARPLADLARYRRFAVTWTGAEGFHLQGQEVASLVSAEEPGAGPGTGAGWLAELGDADLPQANRAQIYTYPASGLAEVTATVLSVPELCGQSLNGQTISSRAGRAEATALRVDLPECTAGPLLMPLKNLDQEMKLALR